MSIAAFLAKAVPWPINGQQGYVNIHQLNRDPVTHASRGMSGRAFISHSRACGYISGVLKLGVDLFVCMSLQRDANAGYDKRNKPIWRAMRHASAALLLRAFWADIDVKPGAFATTADAKIAFDLWCAKVGLPKPTFIVLTGSGGFHVHWVLDDAIDVAVWLPIAHALQNAFKTHHFPCDYGVIIDPARVLRLPGTMNYKDPANPRPATLDQALNYTYPLSAIEGPLAAYKVAYALPASPPPGQPLPPGMVLNPKLAGLAPTPLDAGITPALPTLDDVIRGGCLWLDGLKNSHGAGCSEPEWFEAVKTCTFIHDGDKVVHDLSDGHAGYDPAQTDQKYQQASATHGNGGLGWPQCRTIDAAGTMACKACPHLVSGRSPLNHAQAASAAPPAAPPAAPSGYVPPRPGAPKAAPGLLRPPDMALGRAGNWGYGELPLTGEYRYTIDGRVEVEEEHPDPADKNKAITEWVLVCPMPLYDIKAFRTATDGRGGFGVSFIAQTDYSNLDPIHVQLGDATDDKAFAKTCGAQGLTLRKPAKLRTLMMSFREQLWEHKQTADPSEGLGWSVPKGEAEPDGFCYAGLKHSAAGSTTFTAVSAKIAAMYVPSGSLDYWKQAALLITGQNRPDLNAIIASTLAAPLVYWTGHAGIVLSAYAAASGIGKSHAMRIGQAFWGSPTIGMGGLDDTSNYVGDRVALLRNLPFFFDELRQEEDIKKLVQMIFAMGQGKSKGRMSANAEAKDVYEFSTLLTVASNNSLLGHINDHVKTTNAGINRIFELPVETVRGAPGLIDPTIAQRINGGLNTNYGHPGAAYAKFLGENIALVRDAVASTTEAFHKALGANHDERFWVSTIAVIVLGARFGNKLGLTQIDEEGLVRYFVAQFAKNREYRTGSAVDIDTPGNAERYVQEYVNARRDGTIITDRVWTHNSRPPANFKPVILNSEGRFDGKLLVRIAKDDKLLRITMSDFGSWLKKEKGVPRDLVVGALVKGGSCRKTKVTISAGTKFSTAREDGLEFDLLKLPRMFDL